MVELLLEAKAGTVIAATRDPAKRADLAARGAVVREADFGDEASLVAAFAGVWRRRRAIWRRRRLRCSISRAARPTSVADVLAAHHEALVAA